MLKIKEYFTVMNISAGLLTVFLFWLLFFKYSSFFGGIVISNQSVLIEIFCLILLFSLIGFYLKRCGFKLDPNVTIALFAVILTLVFFLHQNYQQTFNRVQALQILTNNNCELSKSILKSVNNPGTQHQYLDRFSTDLYTQESSFILNEFGPDALKYSIISASDMSQENQVLDEIRDSNMLGQMGRVRLYEYGLGSAGDGTKVVTCDILQPIFLSATPKYINTSLVNAMSIMFMNFFKK